MPYAHPEALVSSQWLARHSDDPHVRILDASFKMPGIAPTAAEDYAAAHVPGAAFFDIDAIADHSSSLPHMLPGEAAFAAAMGELGVGDEDLAVVYDSAGLVGAARAWWMLRAFGHDKVTILDGGLPKWRAENHPVTAMPAPPRRASFTARFDPALVRDKALLLANLAGGAEQVLDARAADRFEGRAAEPWPGRRSGHIPGSRNLPYPLLTDPADRTLLPAEELEHRFREAGVDRGRPVVCSCGSGITACVLAFGLHLLGRTDVAVYDGSWAEWGLPGETPIATGPAG
jgi:thiosulfate/3-mercaptopyruvate sulfurtransferase